MKSRQRCFKRQNIRPWLVPAVRESVRRALAEDIGSGDITSKALIKPDRMVSAAIIARGQYVVSGGEIARLAFRLVDKNIVCRSVKADGRKVYAGEPLMVLKGRARSILAAERTALNFFQRMTGIATLTARFVAAVKPYRTLILDTRKTTPNMRLLEKYAVRCGGGHNHRLGLHDMVLIKDNHRALCARRMSLADAVRAARRLSPKTPVEAEVESPAQLKDVMRAAPDWILLDNMRPALIRKCVRICSGICRLEASGGINLRNVRTIAATGVDAVSIGGLTHSAPAADLSLELNH